MAVPLPEETPYNVYEDEWVRVVGIEIAGAEWLSWECVECGEEQNGSGTADDREALISDTRMMGWWHVEKHMRGDSAGPSETWRVVREFNQGLTSEE